MSSLFSLFWRKVKTENLCPNRLSLTMDSGNERRLPAAQFSHRELSSGIGIATSFLRKLLSRSLRGLHRNIYTLLAVLWGKQTLSHRSFPKSWKIYIIRRNSCRIIYHVMISINKYRVRDSKGRFTEHLSVKDRANKKEK